MKLWTEGNGEPPRGLLGGALGAIVRPSPRARFAVSPALLGELPSVGGMAVMAVTLTVIGAGILAAVYWND